MYEEYKEKKLKEHALEMEEAKIMIHWYETEVTVGKYNGKIKAQESLDVWKRRLEDLTRRQKMLKEMFNNYETSGRNN